MIDYIEIDNYKSIKSLKMEMKNRNILVGANGAGKTNLISFFKLLNELSEERLQEFIAKSGGIDNILYFGSQTSDYIYAKVNFSRNTYEMMLSPDDVGDYYFSNEKISYFTPYNTDYKESIGNYKKESQLNKTNTPVANYVRDYFNSFKVYHFHDTSSSAKVKQLCNVDDNRYLRYDASNLAAFLYRIKKTNPENFQRIEETIRLIAPYFDKFKLEPSATNDSLIRIEWQEKGNDKYFNAHHFSDGTLRMICLITILLQPTLPTTIIIDEPELGLHPYAIFILSELIKSVEEESQIILSTQSVTLINHFTPEDLIVVDKENNESTFKRPNAEELEVWLEDYTLGEIWEKNIIGGRP